MSEVRWIKITTDMFEDEKIDFISSLPEADAILVTWIRLLTLAGKCNAGGYIYLTERIPYTDEMLAHKFKRPLNIIKLALETFRRLDMIEMDANGIFLPKWEKHQNIDGLEKMRKQTALRVAKHREQQKMLMESNVTCNVTVTQGNATDKDKEQEQEKEQIPYREIIDYLNQKAGTSYKPSTDKTRECIRARWNEGFRLEDFQKVIDNKVFSWLKDAEMSKYLRPTTLFGTKFEGYLNEQRVDKPTEQTYHPPLYR